MTETFRKIIFTLLLLSATATLHAQRLTREEYILKHKHLAAETMEKYGIPASIVMAQALLESDNGNSSLAREACNHFGIKCGGNWPGETITHHDDARDECFRVYGSIEESFLDHGAFLDNSPRYNRLFDLKEDDYRAWANGLRECGYATNPNYGPMLVKIIEDNKLYLLDQGIEVTYADIRTETAPVAIGAENPKVDVDHYSVTIDRLTGREIGHNNGAPYITARQGDSFASIAHEFRIGTKKLLKFNDLTQELTLRPGDALYIGTKHKRALSGPAIYGVKAGDTLHSVAQQHGIRLKSLARINRLAPDAPDAPLREGEQIRLR
jgi:LysM repeat protein